MIVWRIACRTCRRIARERYFVRTSSSPHINANCCHYNVSHSINFRDNCNNGDRAKTIFHSCRLAMLKKIELRDSSRRVLNLTSLRRSLLKNKENLILKKEKARLLYTRRARGNAYIAFTLHKSREQINFHSLLNLRNKFSKPQRCDHSKINLRRPLINLTRRAKKTPFFRRIGLPNDWNKASKT